MVYFCCVHKIVIQIMRKLLCGSSAQTMKLQKNKKTHTHTKKQGKTENRQKLRGMENRSYHKHLRIVHVLGPFTTVATGWRASRKRKMQNAIFVVRQTFIGSINSVIFHIVCISICPEYVSHQNSAALFRHSTRTSSALAIVVVVYLMVFISAIIWERKTTHVRVYRIVNVFALELPRRGRMCFELYVCGDFHRTRARALAIHSFQSEANRSLNRCERKIRNMMRSHPGILVRTICAQQIYTRLKTIFYLFVWQSEAIA